MSHSLYVVFSATPYKMGSFIRRMTGEPYNHISLATEDRLEECYAFARRYYRTPFYGGFVTEGPSRFCPKGIPSHIRVYRLPLTNKQRDLLQDILRQMQKNPDQYLYNHLSVLTAPIHRKVRLRDAFTCAEFAVSVLGRLGFDFDPNKFYTIGAIARRLSDYHVYTGDYPICADEDPVFFQPNPVRHPLFTSAKYFFALFSRVRSV